MLSPRLLHAHSFLWRAHRLPRRARCLPKCCLGHVFSTSLGDCSARLRQCDRLHFKALSFFLALDVGLSILELCYELVSLECPNPSIAKNLLLSSYFCWLGSFMKVHAGRAEDRGVRRQLEGHQTLSPRQGTVHAVLCPAEACCLDAQYILVARVYNACTRLRRIDERTPTIPNLCIQGGYVHQRSSGLISFA